MIDLHWEIVETKMVPSKKDGTERKITVRRNVATGDYIDCSDTGVVWNVEEDSFCCSQKKSSRNC